jgi:hypothetical protein
MLIFAPYSVEQEPQVWLENWSIYEVSDAYKPGERSRHFVGTEVGHMSGYAGRVSSQVVSFDIKTMRGSTQSGRLYELVGKPGNNVDALDAWDTWRRMSKGRDARDVTADVWKQGFSED